MRVLHVFPYDSRVSGGHSNGIRALLEAQLKADVDASGISPIDEDLGAPLVSDPLVKFAASDVGMANLATSWLSNSSDRGALIHVHSFGRRTRLVIQAGRAAGCRHVFTSHGTLSTRSELQRLIKGAYLNLWDETVRHAAGVHFLTQREAGQVHRLARLPLDLKVVVAPHVIEVPEGHADRSLRARYGCRTDQFLFGYIGRLDTRPKGLDLVIRAASELRGIESTPPFAVALAGPDSAGQQRTLEGQVDQLDLRGVITFVPPLAGRDKWEFLRSSDAFLYPSRWEAFGIALVEALGTGLPAITTSSINLADDLLSSDAAFITKPTVDGLVSAMQALMLDSDLRNRLGTNASKWVRQNCSPAAVGPTFRRFYHSLLN